MRNIDDILAAAQKAMAASLHEAFEAGRAHAVTDLKTKLASFFEGLAGEAEAQAAAHAPAPPPDSPSSEEHHHHD